MINMHPINIVYIDDRIDPLLSRYLDEYCSFSDNTALLYAEVPFNSKDTYESLLRNETVRTANVLLIDSRLFEEANIGSGMFSGEEFRVILNKLLPYIEVVVISQNDLDIKWSVVEKCKGARDYNHVKQYYDENLRPILNNKCSIVDETWKIIERLQTDKSIDVALVEKIQRIANGETEYDELKASDIDRIVQTFQELIAKDN